MLMPKKVKWRKQNRGRMRGQTKGGDLVSFGDYGLKALEPGWISSRQIEAARVAISRAMSRAGKRGTAGWRGWRRFLECLEWEVFFQVL